MITTAPTVRALRPTGSVHFRAVRARELVRERFWVIPSLFLVGSAITAILVADSGRVVTIGTWHGWQGTAASASSILSVIATAMLTFVGVVFTITLVALQLASSQLSPRVLRTFVRSTVTKVAFGIFIATFTFALTMLTKVSSTSSATSVDESVTISMLLVGASLVVFLLYVTATMNLLRVSCVVSAVANEARAAIDANQAPEGDYREVSPPALVPHPVLVRLDESFWFRRYARSQGVLLGIDRARLVALGRKHDCVIELVPRVGEYLPAAGVMFAIHGTEGPSARQLRAAIQLGRERTLYQDPEYGIRQLVDVAAQALSPAQNQPTTAVLVIDRLVDLLARFARRPDRTGISCDQSDTVRLLEPVTDWVMLVELTFTEITSYGRVAPQVTRRLASALQQLLGMVPDDRRPALAAQVDALNAQVRGLTQAPALDALALRPDPLGLG